MLKSKLNFNKLDENIPSKERNSISQNQISKYEDTIKQMYLERNRLTNELEVLKNEINTLKEERDEAVFMNTNVEEELGKLMESFNEMNAECEKMAAEREEMENYIAFLEQNNNQLKNEMDKKISNKVNESKMIEDSSIKNEEIGFLRQELKSQKELTEQISKQRMNIINENEALTKKFEEISLENEKLILKLNEFEIFCGQNENQINQLQLQNENLNKIIETLNQNHGEEKSDVKRLEDKIKELNLKQKEVQLSFENLLSIEKSKSQNLEFEIKSLKTSNNNLSKTLSDEREKHVNEISSNYEAISSMRTELRTVKDELKYFQNKNEELLNSLANAQQEISQYKENVGYQDSRTKDFQNLREELQNAQNKNFELENKFKSEVNFYENKLDEYERKINKIQNDKKEGTNLPNSPNGLELYSKLNEILTYLKFNSPSEIKSFKADLKIKNIHYLTEEINHYIKSFVQLCLDKKHDTSNLMKENQELKFLLNDQEERISQIKRESEEKISKISINKKEKREENEILIRNLSTERDYLYIF